MKILIPAFLLRLGNYWVVARTVIRLLAEANIQRPIFERVEDAQSNQWENV